MPDITFLGTSAALPTADRGYTSLLISDEQIAMLVDCGAIVYQALLQATINPDTITDLFITHAHIDHIGGLPSFLECLRLSGRRAPLRLWALPETMEIVQGILKVFAFEIPLPLPYSLEMHLLEGDGRCPALGSAAFSFTLVEHSVPTAGLRLSFPRSDSSTWTVVYSSDTRLTRGLESFARGCDLLILECTYLNSSSAKAERVGHMTAGQAGQLAQQAGAGALALVHLGLYDDWNTDQAYQQVAQHFSGPIIFPDDRDRLHY